MSVGPLRLSLFVPGLLGPLPGMRVPGFPEPCWPALTRLLSRARRIPARGDGESLRYALFNYALAENHDRPDAWLSYQVDTGRVAEGPLLCADPVHLRADQHRLILFDATQLDIRPDEAQSLAEAFNRHYAADGLHLEAPATTRWYLHLTERPDMRTTPLAQVMGRDIDSYLPAGPAAGRWQRLVNEVQMLFHAHPVNRERESRGRPMINSLWFWGGGSSQTAMAQDWQRVWSEEVRVQALARLNGVPCLPAPEYADAWLHEVVGDRHLLCLEQLRTAVAYAGLEAWLAGVERLDVVWFMPLLNALRHGRLRELRLYPADGHVYRVTRWDLWRFWKPLRLPMHADMER